MENHKTTVPNSCRKLLGQLLIIGALVFSCLNFSSAQPDLVIDLNYLLNDLFLNANYNADQCEVEEGCANAVGTRKVLQFGTRSMNIGDADIVMGSPQSNPDLFEFHSCHQHYHFNSFANYEFFNVDCGGSGTGHKMSFCILNSGTVDGSPVSCGNCSTLDGECGGYNCLNQGLGAGCVDVYGSSLDCQMVDITDIPDGRYYFKVSLNFEQVLPESDYSNNSVYLLLDIQGNTFDIVYSGTSDPLNLVIEDLDNNDPPDDVLPPLTIVNDTIDILGQTTINDNIDRQIIASKNITLKPGPNPVTISASQGGRTSLETAPCLTSGSVPPPAESAVADLSTRISLPDFSTQDIRAIEDQDREPDEDETPLRVFPNPARMGQFTVAWAADGEQSAKIKIYDARGRLVLQKDVFGISEIALDLSDAAKGVYTVVVLTKGGLRRGSVANF